MYAVRAVLVSLSVFALVYTGALAILACAWPHIRRFSKRMRVPRLASLLFYSQIAPFLAAAITVVCFALPSFLRLEPHSKEEELGWLPILLAGITIAALLVRIWAACRSIRQTHRSVHAWANTVLAADCDEVGVPAFHTNCEGLFAVAGVVNPRLFVSHDVRALLSEEEFKCAMAHEMVHVSRRDNLAKLLVNICGVPAMNSLRREWQQALEMTADHYAVRTRAQALDLASALVKMSRLRLHRLPELATGFAVAETAPLSARIERLLAWNDAPQQPPQALRLTAALLCATGVLIAAISYPAILLHVHMFTEWLVR